MVLFLKLEFVVSGWDDEKGKQNRARKKTKVNSDWISFGFIEVCAFGFGMAYLIQYYAGF